MAARTGTICIMCGERKPGIGLRDDNVIRAVRFAKLRILKREPQTKSPVVCRQCYDKYEQARNKYKSREKIYVGLALVFAILGIALRPSIGSLGYGIFVVALFYAIALLNYMPELDLRGPRRHEERIAPRSRKKRVLPSAQV